MFYKCDRPNIDRSHVYKPRSFQNSCVIKTGFPDFQKITVTVAKTHFQNTVKPVYSEHAI